eukprot:3874368-Pleurochrysis_carterae.AAC.1
MRACLHTTLPEYWPSRSQPRFQAKQQTREESSRAPRLGGAEQAARLAGTAAAPARHAALGLTLRRAGAHAVPLCYLKYPVGPTVGGSVHA